MIKITKIQKLGWRGGGGGEIIKKILGLKKKKI